MKECKDCNFAEWDRTKSGRLHPSGDGRCTKIIKMPKLPQSFYYTVHPNIGGGHINRRETFKDHCIYYK